MLLWDFEKEVIMEVTAWNNGSHHTTGSGYGFKVSIVDRDQFFKKEWKYILLEIEGEPEVISVNIDKATFWNDTCHELIHKSIGKWMLKHGLAPWIKGKPPKFILETVEGNRFRVGMV